MAPISPFLDPGPCTRSGALAIVQLSRDQYQPVYLHDAGGGAVDGYAEGAVLNTRFGSFPHSTMIGVPWGSQVRASVVDTGSRGRKRKRGGVGEGEGEGAGTGGEGGETPMASDGGSASGAATPVPARKSRALPPVAASGFVHVLPPTPEIWTLSLPHRTQVVYTSDYSYVLHRLRARPGTHIIEAGSGSGSFTHAAARAVYGTSTSTSTSTTTSMGDGRAGHVYSFEFHNERFRAMQAELQSHGLAAGGGGDDAADGVVTLTNRDVYADGFLLDDGTSPAADAVFLDLPAPWRALPHLTRAVAGADAASPGRSALNPRRSVYLCTFSPCIEQVTRTVSMMRRLGWTDIDMVEVANKRILVYRERPELVSGRGSAGTAAAGKTVPAPRDVGEAVARLKAIEARTREYNRKYWEQREAEEAAAAGNSTGDAMAIDKDDTEVKDAMGVKNAKDAAQAKPPKPAGNGAKTISRTDDDDNEPPPPFLEGMLSSRIEPEVKTHTSYLVFAVLPRAWSAEDEAAAAARWPVGNEQATIGAVQREVRKEQKRQQMRGHKNKA